MKTYRLGRIAGLKLRAGQQAIIGTIVLWALLTVIGVGLLKLPLGIAILGGLIATLLHWGSELVHNLGHAWAARRTGYPMSGVWLGAGFVLGTSLYPPDEGELPADVHIRRALGGPLASLILTIVAGILTLLLWPVGGVIRWVAVFFFVENLFIFTLGAFLPLGFTDGSTILTWMGKRSDT